MSGFKKTASVLLSLCMAVTPLSGVGIVSASDNGGDDTECGIGGGFRYRGGSSD